VDASFHVWIRRIGVALLVAIIAALLFPLSAQIAAPFIHIVVWAAAALGYVFIIAGIPFLLWMIGRVVFRTFVTPYVRIRRIRMIRERRLMAEAAMRSGTGQR
jgi:hypothetical protein